MRIRHSYCTNTQRRYQETPTQQAADYIFRPSRWLLLPALLQEGTFIATDINTLSIVLHQKYKEWHTHGLLVGIPITQDGSIYSHNTLAYFANGDQVANTCTAKLQPQI